MLHALRAVAASLSNLLARFAPASPRANASSRDAFSIAASLSNLLARFAPASPRADLTNVRHLTDEEAEALAMSLMGESGFFMIEDFMYTARVSYSTAYRHLRKMVERGVLYRGGGRGRAIYTRP